MLGQGDAEVCCRYLVLLDLFWVYQGIVICVGLWPSYQTKYEEGEKRREERGDLEVLDTGVVQSVKRTGCCKVVAGVGFCVRRSWCHGSLTLGEL